MIHDRDHDHESHAPDNRGRGAGELAPAAQDLFDQIEELTERECPQKYRKTWRLRLSEKRNEIPAFKAIGETRMLKRQGKIKKSVGGTLNHYFILFREGSKRNF